MEGVGGLEEQLSKMEIGQKCTIPEGPRINIRPSRSYKRGIASQDYQLAIVTEFLVEAK